MWSTRAIGKFGALTLLLGVAAGGAHAQDPAPTAPAAEEVRIDETAAKHMKAACEFLKSKPAFSVRSEATVDEIFRNGHRVLRSRGTTVVLKRPDRFWADIESDRGHRSMHFDGKSLVINDIDAGVYGRVDAPGTVEQMLDIATERFDVTLPLADLLSENPCAALKTAVTRGWYLGKHYFDGGRYHHLFFSAPEVDLQVWIADGKEPLLRRMVLTYKNEPGEPQYGVALSKWNFAPALDKVPFAFQPPKGAQEIDFVTTEAAATDAAAKE
jgi:hypothetical protein